jgi:protein-S-isoprenylcysteine O-methyltransferase Ste14
MSIKFGEDFAKKGGWWVVAQVALFALLLAALTRNVDPSLPLQITGWLLVVAGLGLGGSGMWMIRRRMTAMPAPLEGAVLMESGAFSLVRHPIYGGVCLGFLGLSIKGGNVDALALSLLLLVFFYAKTEHEERLLIERFPDYAGYRRRVRSRILPWVL